MDANILELRVREWLPIFEAQAKSGLNKKEWCEKNGIKRWEFYKRLRDCRRYILEKPDTTSELAPSPKELPSFVEIPVKACPDPDPVSDEIRSKDPGVINISCGKFRVSLEGSVDRETLAAVIREVSHA